MSLTINDIIDSINEDGTGDALLDRYLKSRGVNPLYLTKDRKIAYAKSDDYKKWKMDHMSEEVQLTEDGLLDRYLSSRGINSRYATKITKISHSKSDMFKKWKRDHMFENDASIKVKKNLNDFVKSKKEPNQNTAMIPEARHYVKLVRVVSEDTFQDPQAATQTVSDGANSPNDLSEKRRQLSKSARIIKSIYKKQRVAEEMFDGEKEDKSVQTYGKKPKFEKADKDSEKGEKKPTAAAVLSGGTTLTGEKRDDVEIDPMMRNRPGQPDVTKKDEKDKDKKKEEKK